MVAMTCDVMRKHGGVYLTCDSPDPHPARAHHDPDGIWWSASPMTPEKDWEWVRAAHGDRPLGPDKALAVIMAVVQVWTRNGELAVHDLADLMNHLDWLDDQLTRGRELPAPWRDGHGILEWASEDLRRYKNPPPEVAARYLDAVWFRAYGEPYPGAEKAREQAEAEAEVIGRE